MIVFSQIVFSQTGGGMGLQMRLALWTSGRFVTM